MPGRDDMWKWEANEKNGCALRLGMKNGNFCKQCFTLGQWFLTRGNFSPLETFGNTWRYF